MLWHKVWADLWLHKSRTLLAIMSISAGVICVGTLFGMIDLQLSKMDAAHKQSIPSHISMFLKQDADHSLLSSIRSINGVSEIDTMTQLSIQVKTASSSKWQFATLIFRSEPDLQKFDRSALFEGVWPQENHLAIENLSSRYAEVKPNSNIEVQTETGTLPFNITGIVRHPFVKPPSFGGQLHFFSGMENAKMFGIPSNSFRQLLVQVTHPYNFDKAREIARQIQEQLMDHGIQVSAILLQDPEKHWGRPFFLGVNQVLKFMAVAALFLACLLIFNIVAAHIKQQTNEIGVMKALGARTITLVQLYLTEILLIALLAATIAIPIGLSAAYWSSCKILSLFNIDCGPFDFSLRALMLMALGGLLIPLLAALPPVISGATMTVRTAIASYGLGSNFGSQRFDRWLEKTGALFLSTINAAALSNLFRRKGRFVLTQLSLIIAGLTFMVLMSLITSVNLTLDNEMSRSRFDVRLGLRPDQAEQTVRKVVNKFSRTNSVEVWQRLPMTMSQAGQTLRQKGSLGSQIIALPVESRMYRPLIEEGRWFKSSDIGQQVIILSADTARLNGLKVGDSIEIKLFADRSDWKIIGFYRWLAGNEFTVEPVYAPITTVRQQLQWDDQASFVMLDAELDGIHQEAEYMDAVKTAFESNGINLDVYTTQAKLEQRQFVQNQFKPVVGTLSGLAAMIVIVGAIGLTGTLTINVLQRTREIGVMRSLGARYHQIYRLFLLEGLLHGFFSWMFSVPLAFFAAKPISDLLGKTMLGIRLDFAFDYLASVYWLGIILFVALIASYWPARKAALLTVRQCLGH